MNTKFVMIVQCDKSRKRCSGFACTKTFYDKEGFFKKFNYDDDTKYIAFTCGGCNGDNLDTYLKHFSQKLLKKTELKKDEIAVHLSSCITTENYHHDRCPFIHNLEKIVKENGYKTLRYGTYLSKKAEERRKAGIYKDYKY